MKKLKFACLGLLCASCATILTPKATTYQKTKPAQGQPQREIRAGYLVLDILFGIIPVAVDFGTAKIYKPEPSKKK